MSFPRGLFHKSGGSPVPLGIIVGWAGTNASIPGGWTRHTALDDRYAKMVATSGTNPGATGGANTHTHSESSGHTHTYGSHTHTWPVTAANDNPTNNNGSGTSIEASGSHTHTVSDSGGTPTAGANTTGTYASATGEPAFIRIIFIKSDGSPSGIPNNAIAFYNAAAPTGWSAHAASSGTVWKGATAGGDGGAIGGGTHTHTGPSHTHANAAHTHPMVVGVSNSAGTTTGSGSVGLASRNHTHSLGSYASSSVTHATNTGSQTDTANAGDSTPPWYKVLPIQNTSGVNSWPTGLIAMWSGTLASIPLKWAICDGNGGTPNLSNSKFVRGAANSGEVGSTGGAATHTHTSAGHTHTSGDAGHTHTSSGTSGGESTTLVANAAGSGVETSHTHGAGAGASGSTTVADIASQTGNISANSDNTPVYTELAYVKYTA